MGCGLRKELQLQMVNGVEPGTGSLDGLSVEVPVDPADAWRCRSKAPHVPRVNAGRE